MNDENKYGWIKLLEWRRFEHKILHFWVGIKYVLCPKVIKIIESEYVNYVNDEIKYVWIKNTQVDNDFSMFKGGLK